MMHAPKNVFVAFVEKAGGTFIVELEDETILVGKITAKRVGHRVSVSSPSGIGIELDVGGCEKRFINGDQIDRTYKACDTAKEAQEWILARKPLGIKENSKK